jgi:signal transduction histidine kinase/NAD-dependent dihydropyrimidine dehydrogenase PreA subunit
MSITKKLQDITVSHRRCRRCSYCVQICPAKAITFDKDAIKIIPDRCVLCGNCIKGCPQHALSHKTSIDRLRGLLSQGKTIACLDPVFVAALEVSSPRQLVTALKRIGFDEVWEGAFGVELIAHEYRKLLSGDWNWPLISSFCPAVVFYIEKYFPSLIPHLAPIVSPMIAIGRAAKYLKGEDWKVVYVTWCLAQSGEMRSPEVAGAIDQVITFADVKVLMDEAGIHRPEIEEHEFDGPRPFLGRIVPVVGGLYRSMGANFDVMLDEISVTGGSRRAVGALNQLVTGQIKAKFLDFVFCEGCIDGPFVDRELTVLARRQIVARYTKSEMNRQSGFDAVAAVKRFQNMDLSRTFTAMEQKLRTPTEDEIRSILKKIGKLPPNGNLDCRACGYPTCRDKAVAVAQGLADPEYCLPYLLEQSKQIYHELERSHRELQISHNELEQAQKHIFRTEKLASIGQLAAGVAHEINNPLGTITIYAHLLQKGMEADDPRREDISLIISEASRAKEIVQGLLSFARETKLRTGPMNVNDIFTDVLGLVVNQPLFHNITVKQSLYAELPTIVADEAQIKQVFLNIILNAAQAMEGNGELTITTTREDNEIKIRIADTGPGIPPEIMGKLFNPFFTTKEKGTGLGLAIVYGIIERHQGTVDVETELGKGSAFILSLPISTEEAHNDMEITRVPNQNITLTGRGNHGQKTKNSAC